MSPQKKPKTYKNNKTKSAKLANKKEALRDNYVGSINEKSHEGEESSEGKGSSEGECMMQDAHKDLHKSIPDEQDPYANSNIQTLVENLDSNSIVQGFIMS